jgi:protein involved in polysaccharide export with SLBB domain
VSFVCFSVATFNFAQAPLTSDTSGVSWSDSYRYFDQPIDPDLYLIRPGDNLLVTFIKAKLEPLTLSVDPEGMVIDATLGVFDLSHKTLSEAKEILGRALRALYNVDKIAISVAEPAKVAISISGGVHSPGLYLAFTSQRVSEIIDSAGGVLSTGSRRWIVFSGGPQEITVDLDRADFLGDNTANPCLYAGYNVHVPGKSNELVQVVGEVNGPREIELAPDDDVKLLLDLAGGARSNADLDGVRILGRNPQIQNQNIKAGDIIMVPARTQGNESGNLTVFGAVENPGKHAYQQKITLEELIQLAGGFTSYANSFRTTVFRKARFDEWGRITNVRYPISNIVKDDTQVEAMPLQPADSVFVPARVGYVKVTGAVHNPGLFPYLDGGAALSYINAAGGFLPSAEDDRIDVYNRVSKTTTSVSPDVQVHDGDEVIVDVREELK